jgi:hypothetical protein
VRSSTGENRFVRFIDWGEPVTSLHRPGRTRSFPSSTGEKSTLSGEFLGVSCPLDDGIARVLPTRRRASAPSPQSPVPGRRSSSRRVVESEVSAGQSHPMGASTRIDPFQWGVSARRLIQWGEPVQNHHPPGRKRRFRASFSACPAHSMKVSHGFSPLDELGELGGQQHGQVDVASQRHRGRGATPRHYPTARVESRTTREVASSTRGEIGCSPRLRPSSVATATRPISCSGACTVVRNRIGETSA